MDYLIESLKDLPEESKRAVLRRILDDQSISEEFKEKIRAKFIKERIVIP